MPGIKPSLKSKIKKLFAEHKKTAIASLIAILLIFSFVAYRVWLNIHFLITDDLILELEPQDKSLLVHYGETSNVTFKVNIENSVFCDTYCNYEFKDISSELILDKGSFSGSGIGKKFERTYNVSAGRVGSGQKIYSLEVQCNNIRTWHCLTNENKRRRSSLVVLNYGISDYEQFLKDTLKDNITGLVKELSLADIKLQQLNNRFFELGFNLNFRDLEDDKEILNNNFSQILLEFKNLERVWSEEDYLLLYQLFNKSYDERVKALDAQIVDLNFKVDNVLARHNSIIKSLTDFDNGQRSQNSTITFLGSIQNPLILQHKNLLDSTAELKTSILHNIFTNYDFLENGLEYLELMGNNFESAITDHYANAFVEGTYYYSLERYMLCKIRGICFSETNFSAAIENSRVIDYQKIQNTCSLIDRFRQIYEAENKKSEEMAKNYNPEEISPILENASKSILIAARNDIFDDIRNISANNESNKSLSTLLDLSYSEENTEEIDYLILNESEALSLMQLNLTNDSEVYYGKYCKAVPFDISSHYGNATDIFMAEDVETGNFTSRIDMELTPNHPICCVFGECKRCCTQEECKSDPALYPVLILHGHAFNRDNSPDFSLDAFNKIQSSLHQSGYISAGIMTPKSDYSEIKKGEWGLSSRPITVKGSYYLVSYYNLGSYSIAMQKSENIETYAIRLKELIDLLKFRTGKDKVVIIAHSMGGLVARSYMDIFGDSSVDKLILIATPNKGVSGKISNYCPVLGEKKECSDMSAESIFIKKLNDPLKEPINAKLYNIVGIGCSMNGNTGDGVVVKENAKLDYAENFYISGNCSGTSLLHAQILNIDAYPEVYGTIQSFLKQ